MEFLLFGMANFEDFSMTEKKDSDILPKMVVEENKTTTQGLPPIEYLKYTSFRHKYYSCLASKRVLSKGQNGTVFELTQDVTDFQRQFVIKQLPAEESLVTFLPEINAFAHISHPCILRPVAWSLHHAKAYMALPKGIPIEAALAQEQISIEQIISDVLHVLVYLNGLGLAHCDVKPSNMIFHENKCKLIDFGMCREWVFDATSRQCCITGLAGTPLYRDPVLSNNNQNIKMDLYALALSIHQLITKAPVPVQNVELINWASLCPTNPDVQIVLRLALAQSCSLRLSSKELLRITPSSVLVRRHPTFCLLFDSNNADHWTGIIKDRTQSIWDQRLGVLLRWMLDVAVAHKFSSRSVFLAFHLLHRIYEHMLVWCSSRNEMLNTNFKLLASVTMYIACTLPSAGYEQQFTIGLDLDFWKQVYDDRLPEYDHRFYKMLKNICVFTQGILTTRTYWDYAQSVEDLILFLPDYFVWEFHTKPVRALTGKQNNKHVFIHELVRENFQPLFREKIAL